MKKRSDTDFVVGAGLIVVLIVYLIIVGLIAFSKDVVLPLDVAGNIAVGLVGYLGRSLVERRDDNYVNPKPPTFDAGDHSEGARYSASITLPERKS